MRRLIPALALLAAVLSAPAHADYETGKKAFAAKDWPAAIRELRPAVEAGDPRAATLLARMYLEGNGVVTDPVEAMRLYRRAAEKDDPLAILSIAGIYRQGIGYGKSAKRASQWLGRAAALGHQPSALLYAISLFQGDIENPAEMPPDPKAAYTWLKITAGMNKYPASTARAKELADIVVKRLNAVETAQAEKEAAAWKPSAPGTLGPIPPLENPRDIPPAPPKDLTEKPAAP